MARITTVFLFICLAYGKSSVGQAQKHVGDSSSSSQTTKGDTLGTQAFPLVVNTRAIHSRGEAAEQAAKDAEQKGTNRWNIGLTFAIAVCAFLQTCAIVGQIVVYCRQTKIMNDALVASVKSAAASRDSVRIASDTAVRQLRAYVAVEQVGMMGLESQEPFGVGFAFVNYGSTHATNFRFRGVVSLLPFPLPKHFVLPKAPDRMEQESVIFPKQGNPLTGWVWEDPASPLTLEQKKRLLSPDATQEVYAHGVATYLDVFGQRRETEVCIALNPTSIVRDLRGNIVRTSTGNIQFQWIPVGNRNRIS